MLRGSLVALIFNKTTELPIGDFDQPAAVTLMSTDVDGITSGILDFQKIWADIIAVGLGLYLLERQVGVSCIFVVVLTVGLCCNLPFC